MKNGSKCALWAYYQLIGAIFTLYLCSNRKKNLPIIEKSFILQFKILKSFLNVLKYIIRFSIHSKPVLIIWYSIIIYFDKSEFLDQESTVEFLFRKNYI